MKPVEPPAGVRTYEAQAAKPGGGVLSREAGEDRGGGFSGSAFRSRGF